MKKILIGVLLSFCTSTHAAQLFLETNAFYYSDGLKVGSTTTDTTMLLDFALGFTLDKRGQWVMGWNYSMHTASTSGGSTEDYSSTEMGPKVLYFFDKDRSWSSSFTYNLIVDGSYKASASAATQTLRGSSMRFDVGYGAPITESLRLGGKIIYNASSFNEEIDTTTLTQVSYSRTFIYPALHLSYMF